MTDVQAPPPPDAITLAADAIHFAYLAAGPDQPACLCLPQHPTMRYDQDRERAIKALAAAAPVLRAEGAKTATDAERERIRDMAIRHNAQCHHPDGGGGRFADLLDGDDDG